VSGLSSLNNTDNGTNGAEKLHLLSGGIYYFEPRCIYDNFNVYRMLYLIKVKCIAVNGIPSHSYGVSLAIYGITQHYLLPDTSEHTPP